MKMIKIMMICLLILGLTGAAAFAKHHTPEDRGMTLFNDAKFAGGSKACASCHPNGKGLENAAGKKEFKVAGKTQKSLEEAVNACIVNANKGKAIDAKSDAMKEMVAYIKSLKKGKTTKPAAGY